MQKEFFNGEDTINANLESEFNFREIELLEEPIENILIELEDEVNSGHYKMILGDDASGRIPTDVFGGVIKSIYKEKNFEAPKIRFIPANPNIPEEPLDKRVRLFKKDLGADKPDKILIITDSIVRGEHLRPLVHSLKNNGIKFDVATIGVKGGDINVIKNLKVEFGCNIVFGALTVPNIYGKRYLGGVYKEYGDVVSRSRKKNAKKHEDLAYEGDQEAQKSINKARQDVNKLSGEIYEWYKQKQRDVDGDKN